MSEVFGIGTDIVEVERITAVCLRRGERFLRRVFTPDEVAYCGSGPHRDTRLAARFAAKEAVLKALGMGLRGVRWLEVDIARDALGKPEVRLSGRLAERARQLGVGAILISLSHTRGYAAAFAVAMRAGEERAG